MEKLAAHLTAPFLLFFKYWASFFCPRTGKASFLAHPHYLTAWYQSVSHRNFFLCSPLCLAWFLPLLFLSVHSFICKRPREQNNCVEMIYTLKKKYWPQGRAFNISSQNHFFYTLSKMLGHWNMPAGLCALI